VSDAPTAFPLAWPAHRARRAAHLRQRGSFASTVDTPDGYKKTIRVTLAEALKRLNLEVDRIGAKHALLSCNLVDGSRVLNRGEPADPGVCLYCELKAKPLALACDTFATIAQNISALAAHLEATRRIERYGVATAAETLQAFAALPPPIAMGPPARPWWEVFGVMREVADVESVNAIFRAKAKRAHPDGGGSAAVMAELNVALSQALKELA